MREFVPSARDQPTDTMGAFVNLLDAHEFGERVTLTVRRGDERIEVPVTLSRANETRAR